MPGEKPKRLSPEEKRAIIDARRNGMKWNDIPAAFGVSSSTVHAILKKAAERGELGYNPVLPGFQIAETSTTFDADGNVLRQSVRQRPEHGPEFEMPEGHILKGVSVMRSGNGKTVIRWDKTDVDATRREAILRAVAGKLAEGLPALPPLPPPIRHLQADLLNAFFIADGHLGMMAWARETRDADWDLQIAASTMRAWFDAAVALSPAAETALRVNLGDYLHHDGHDSGTPASKHPLDADSRFEKIAAVGADVLQYAIARLLETHNRVHVITATGNHDPASSVWLRTMLPRIYINEPRVTFDSSPGLYYAFEHGLTSIFIHHGHKRPASNIDHVFAAQFRALYGRTRYSYGHVGHLHSKLKHPGTLFEIERHRTLAPLDAYSAGGGFTSIREAAVITYSKRFGETGRVILTPEMLAEREKND